jgi:hypothetical protein
MLPAISIVVRALAIALMLRIALKDFKTQKITNADVLALGCLGIGGLPARPYDWRLLGGFG